MTALPGPGLLQLTATTGIPEVDVLAARAILSVLRSTVWPDGSDAVRRTEAARLREQARRLAQEPRYRSLSRSVYATARMVRGRPCPR